MGDLALRKETDAPKISGDLGFSKRTVVIVSAHNPLL